MIRVAIGTKISINRRIGNIDMKWLTNSSKEFLPLEIGILSNFEIFINEIIKDIVNVISAA